MGYICLFISIGPLKEKHKYIYLTLWRNNLCSNRMTCCLAQKSSVDVFPQRQGEAAQTDNNL